ncbi:MAG: PstS family phosphate ABC transporter substrate-binding protein [Candidatus Heimdallarchaeota archaeon]|nr:PstS family phosphate ABC transporter substrate-binding protein [Candidatus Heimdallarchaeota archaeon]
MSSHTHGAETIRVVGSNTVYPIMDAVGARFSEVKGGEVTLTIEGPGSGAGITALIEQQTDIAPMSRAPKDSEKAEAVVAGIELNITTIALDALVIIVNKANPINGLTKAQITDIYDGTKTSWSEFGWSAGGDISVIERDENSGTHDYFNEFFLDGEEVDPTKVAEHKQEASTSTLFELVASDESAIGYGGLAYMEDTVKALEVDGVAPSKAAAADETYSVARPLFVVFDEKTISDMAREFVNYVLGPEGQYLCDYVGYVALYDVATGLSDTATGDNIPGFEFFLAFFAIAFPIVLRRRV